MEKTSVGCFVAECFWPDVDESDVRAADARIDECVRTVGGVRYCGSILLLEDEVVLCQFEGTASGVRRVVECAEVPFERILATTTYPPRGGSST
ncbi:MAG TPA: hypothetical protein VLK36_16995 [Gaiellaceae bacterium]|nr:hypothetical protein [Gaiellaceae bacterium]